MKNINKEARIGQYVESAAVAGESYAAYIPKPLPPEPPVQLKSLYPLIDQANLALGRLDGMSRVLPDPNLFIYMYIRKEAVLSSQIEGTQSSLSDLLLFETSAVGDVSMDDVAEVSSYVTAMNYGLKRLETLPLSLRLIREIHAKLMNNARGANKQPGEFRRSQNWIGGSRPGNAHFVPPPHEYLIGCLDNFEKFLHDDEIKLPILVKAAIMHVQFETIHPFLDGNGRLGRLLITLQFCITGVLGSPLLYLSLYLKNNRDAYYNHLQSVRETGDWEAWIEFFLTGIVETADQATNAAKAILQLFKRNRAIIENSGKSALSVLTVASYMERHPITKTANIKDHCNISLPSVLRGLRALESLGIVQEISGKERNQIWAYVDYLSIIGQGTEPLD